ncbi:hypothetical protein KIW84_044656 [Lathyrus oleraceus]|uniref:BURP domain-containing protein n=2 Tax=Pisum sativum TaxID=3888 RepID=A0A9D4XIQ7_PEA|nr:hypothetical protein KIW84_044656 [Pisum sativum]
MQQYFVYAHTITKFLSLHSLMEFKNLSVLVLFLLVLVGINGSKSGEEYWKSVWPNTPIPKALSDLMTSDKGANMPIKSQEENQYWTIFFEHDLYPGKTMNLGIQKNSDIQSSKSPRYLPIKKATKTETNTISQPFGVCIWWYKKESDRTNQTFLSSVCDKKETTKEKQPFGISVWWHKKETEKENQPFGFLAWASKETRKANQLYVKDTQKESQYFVSHTSDEKEVQILNSYCRTQSAIGEDKYCALSLESMMDFVISKLGKNVKVMSSSLSQNQDKYVVEEVNKIGDKAVMCHRLNFKKVVFYCHAVNATTTYMVPLVASDGTKSKALTICHHDTRGMNPNVLNEVLNVNPGTVSVCHFIGNKAIAWVPDTSESSGHPCVI